MQALVWKYTSGTGVPPALGSQNAWTTMIGYITGTVFKSKILTPWKAVCYFEKMLDLQSARDAVLSYCQEIELAGLPIEVLPLRNSLARVLAEAVSLDQDQPPFDRSMRDGYAVKSPDVQNCPVTLRYAGEVRAGEWPSEPLNSGQAIQVMTGAPVPAGTDAVVMVEQTERASEADVRVIRPVQSGENIARRGSEYLLGETAIELGRRIKAVEMAILAVTGRSGVRVYGQPSVSILATGDELVAVEETPRPGQIRNSNSFSLLGQISACGACPTLLEVARDDRYDLQRKIQAGLQSDVLLVSGGVSMGKYDLVKETLTRLGARIRFDSVNLRPGKPTVFATLGQKVVFGLPGNPVSTFVTYELFVRPVLERMQGLPFGSLPIVRGILEEPLRDRSGRTSFLPVSARYREDHVEVLPVVWKGSADIFSLTHANGFAIVPKATTYINAGEKVEVLMFSELRFPRRSAFT